MAAVVLQGSLNVARQHVGVSAAACKVLHHANYSTDMKSISKPSLANMRKGAGGRSSFNGVVATVFGASGFLGSYVCNELGKHGSQIIIPYRGDHYDVAPMKLVGDLGQVLFHPFHLCDEASIRQSMKYSNVVINLIGRDWETKNFKFEDVHVHGARRLARIAREEGVEKFIHVSALNCTPNPKPMMLWKGSNILRTKYYGELAVREEFPDAVIIRPSIMFGPQDRFTNHYGGHFRFLLYKFPVYKKGMDATKMPVHVDDVAKGIYAAITNPDSDGQVYQAVGPHRYLYHDLVRWMMDEMQRKAPDFNISDSRFNPLFWAITLLLENLPGRPVDLMHREIMEREATTDVFDFSLPSLLDLGVKLEPLENQMTWLMKQYRAYAYATDEPELFQKVPPPTPIV